MPFRLLQLFGAYRSLSWGQRGYALIVLSAIAVFGYAGINAWRIRTYESFHARIAAAGGRSTRGLTILADYEESYFLALQGDFSAVAITGVLGSGPDCTLDARMFREMRQFPEITSLRLSRMHLGAEEYQAIFQLENLTRLSLSFTDVSDSNLSGIEKLQNLENLDLKFTPLTDGAIPVLEKLGGLSSLDITGTDITPAGADRLRKTYQLIQGPSQMINVIHRVVPTPSGPYRDAVNRLVPTNSYNGDSRNNNIRLLLQSQHWEGHEADIPLLAELKDVENVIVQRMPLSEPLLTAIAALPAVQHLSMTDVSTQGRQLTKLTANGKLRSLRLNGVILEEEFAASFPKLEKLETVVVFNCRLLPGACLRLGECTQLKSLILRQVEVERGELEQLLTRLESSPSLRLLDLSAVPVDNDTIPRFGRLNQLISLGVGQAEVDDSAVPALGALTHLQQLDIQGSGISEGGLAQLETALLPSKTVVVHHKSKTNTYPLSLAELANYRAAQTAATKGVPDAGATPAKVATP